MIRFPTADFSSEPEHEALAEMLGDFLGKTRPATFADRAAPVDRDAWRALGQELGVLGLGIATEEGGPGGTVAHAAVIDREAGRACSSLPVLNLAPVTSLLAAARHEVLGQVIDGATLVAMAGLAPQADEAVTATLSPQGARVNGQVPAVLAGTSADMLLVLAHTPEGRAVVLVDSGAPGHHAEQSSSLDLSREWSRHTFRDTPATIVLPPGNDGELAAALDLARIAATADLVGVAESALHEAVAYSKDRYQFGRAIGSQQAIKHRAVDLSLSLERAVAALEYAVRATGEWRTLASLVAIGCASQTAVEVTTGAIQLLGGIGMTWEHPAHVRMRRVLADRAAFGSPERHRRDIAALLWPSDA